MKRGTVGSPQNSILTSQHCIIDTIYSGTSLVLNRLCMWQLRKNLFCGIVNNVFSSGACFLCSLEFVESWKDLTQSVHT